MSSDTSVLDRAIRRRLEQAINERVTPGAAVAVGSSHGVDLEVCVGSFTYDAAEPVVTRDTLWDLASVTKVIIGVSLCGLAIERSALRLDAAVAEFHPALPV